MQTSAVTFDPISFSDVPGWSDDDHLAAWKAFLASCGAVLKTAQRRPKSPAHLRRIKALLDVCALALAETKAGSRPNAPRRPAFFETYFRPHRVSGAQAARSVDRILRAAAQRFADARSATFKVPIYRRPADLVNVVAESERGAKSASSTHMRQTERGLEPYLTRAEIEEGGLAGQGLELMYFKDPVDVFFMQVQGSGRVELPDGTKVRVAYDGKNGYPYTSIGRALIDEGEISREAMSLKALKQWLRTNSERAKAVMWQNKSYVFFRELTGDEAKGPMGANSIPLQPGRSLAVDTILLRSRNADLRRCSGNHACDEVRRFPTADDCARRRLGDQRRGTRRYLFRLRRRSGPPRRRHETAGTLHRPAAGRPRARTHDSERHTVKKPHGKGGRKGPASTDDEDIWHHTAATIEPLKRGKPRVHLTRCQRAGRR